MRFLRVRRAWASRAACALLALVVFGGAFDWGHAGGDDPDCNPVLIHHDHSAHHFSAAPTGGAPLPDHCYICHSLRLLHTGLTASSARASADTSQTPVHGRVVVVDDRTTVDGRTSRGPPVLSL
jgi:hypothetical protein